MQNETILLANAQAFERRRSALKKLSAIGLLGGLVGAGAMMDSGTDDPEAELHRLFAAFRYSWLEQSATPEENEMYDHLGAQIGDLSDQIEATPARTIVGVLIKLKVALFWIVQDQTVIDYVIHNRPPSGDAVDQLSGDSLLLSAAVDLDRMILINPKTWTAL